MSSSPAMARRQISSLSTRKVRRTSNGWSSGKEPTQLHVAVSPPTRMEGACFEALNALLPIRNTSLDTSGTEVYTELVADAVKGQLEFMLLAVLRAGPAYGYHIIDQLKRRSDGVFDLPESTVYPALHRLEADGLLASDWAVVNGRRRRTYRITARGETALGERKLEWRRFARAVSAVGEAP